MPLTRTTNVAFTLILALLLAGCVTPTTERSSLEELLADARHRASENAGDDHDHDHDHDHGPDDDASHEPSSDEAGQESPSKGQDGANDESDTAAAGTDVAAPAPEPSPASTPSPEPGGPMLEQHSEFPIEVTLSQRCVERGGDMTITVEARHENTAIAYIAFYAGEESGAAPPYGDGHGGNSGDMADSDGHYEDTWVVSPTAPVGPARVEVIAGRDGMKSTALVRFEVIDAGTDGCHQ